MKLNIGSSVPKGRYRSAEWINIDNGADKFGGNVFRVDALDMPGEWTNYFDEIHAIHVLEHINRNRRGDFLAACQRVLIPDGVLYLEVPDFSGVVRRLVKAWDEGDHDLAHKMTTSIFGKQRYTGDQHCWGFTEQTLSELAHMSGFSKIEFFTNVDAGKGKMISDHHLQEPILLMRAVK